MSAVKIILVRSAEDNAKRYSKDLAREHARPRISKFRIKEKEK